MHNIMEPLAVENGELFLPELPAGYSWRTYSIQPAGTRDPWITVELVQVVSVKLTVRVLKALFTFKSVPRTKTVLVSSQAFFYPPELDS